jgi:hypothetical protein
MSFSVGQPVNIITRQANYSTSRDALFEASVYENIKNLAAQQKIPVEKFLNGVSLEEICKTIEQYGKVPEDTIPIIYLTVQKANLVIPALEKEGKRITFAELLGVMKTEYSTEEYGATKIADIAAYLVALKNQETARYARNILAKETIQLDDPQIVYNPLIQNIVFRNREDFLTEKIYKTSNDLDAEFAKIRDKQIATKLNEQRSQDAVKRFESDTERRVAHNRLANLEIQNKLSPAEREYQEIVAKAKTSLIIRT